jgi:hypothetical protein
MNVIEKWKSDDTVVRFLEGDDSYGIRVIGRGEHLFFQENDKALICDIDAANNIIYSASIKNWEGSKKMPDLEKERVIKLIETFYKIYIDENVKVI